MVTSGVKLRLAFSFLVSFIFSLQTLADFTGSLSSNSWQEKLPITYTDPVTTGKISKDFLGTFTTVSFSAGYENLFSKRWRYAIEAGYHFGEVDFHKLQSFVGPRKSLRTISSDIKINYRISKTFTLGPQLGLHTNTIKDVGSGFNYSALLNIDFEIFDNTRLLQTIGTVGGSETLAYSLGLIKIF